MRFQLPVLKDTEFACIILSVSPSHGGNSANSDSHHIQELNYLKMKIFCNSFTETYTRLFTILFFNLLTSSIFMTYIILNPLGQPITVTFCLSLCVTTAVTLCHCTFSIATNSNLLSKKLIRNSLQFYDGISKIDKTFWYGMSPLKLDVGFCSFESKEFLLYVWGEVVIKSIIDLLIAFPR